jgi:GNAT superfamily N-acetyltransferase
MALKFTIRDAVAADVPLIVALVHNLARYQKLEAELTEPLLADAMFGPNSHLFALIAEVDGVAAGFAVYFYNFSTFVGRRGIYMEDLYVDPGYRRHGIGKAMFHRLAQKSVEEKCGRFEWSVLSWNVPALKFYKNIGAVPLSEWHVHRLTGEALQRAASYSAGDS